MMYYILIAVLLALLMARKPKRRSGRFRRYLRGAVDEQMALSTLGAKTAILQAFGSAVTETAYISSIVATWALSDFTAAPGDGPITVGVAHSDYSLAEIEGYIENTGSWTEGDLVQTREIGRRLIRRVGTFRGAPGTNVPTVLNEGKPLRTKLGWLLTTGQTLDLWAYNEGTSPLATTDPQVFVTGHANLWPR